MNILILLALNPITLLMIRAIFFISKVRGSALNRTNSKNYLFSTSTGFIILVFATLLEYPILIDNIPKKEIVLNLDFAITCARVIVVNLILSLFSFLSWNIFNSEEALSGAQKSGLHPRI
ncbi:MAG: hypothetical protein GY909_16020 [Oligoflexia bacterium]|nr:hypothetical protein [Oligoflexia bacterium]